MSGALDANFGCKSGTSKNTFASVLIDFRSSYEGAANAYELRNRDTRSTIPKSGYRFSDKIMRKQMR
jgi:hypothetical protein